MEVHDAPERARPTAQTVCLGKNGSVLEMLRDVHALFQYGAQKSRQGSKHMIKRTNTSIHNL